MNHLLKLLKKVKEKKDLSKPRKAFQPPKVSVMCLHEIDQNNVRLYQGLVVHLNPKTVVGAKSRPTKLVGSLDFRPGLPNFNEVIKAIENVTSLTPHPIFEKTRILKIKFGPIFLVAIWCLKVS